MGNDPSVCLQRPQSFRDRFIEPLGFQPNDYLVISAKLKLPLRALPSRIYDGLLACHSTPPVLAKTSAFRGTYSRRFIRCLPLVSGRQTTLPAGMSSPPSWLRIRLFDTHRLHRIPCQRNSSTASSSRNAEHFREFILRSYR